MYKKNEAAHIHNGFLQALSHGSHLSHKNSAMQDMVSTMFPTLTSRCPLNHRGLGECVLTISEQVELAIRPHVPESGFTCKCTLIDALLIVYLSDLMKFTNECLMNNARARQCLMRVKICHVSILPLMEKCQLGYSHKNLTSVHKVLRYFFFLNTSEMVLKGFISTGN